MEKPISLFLGGVQKCGTTSLFAHFCDHHELSSPSVKELHFFDDEQRDWAKPAYGSIDKYFSPDDGEALRFDATPIYIFWPPSIPRIHAYNTKAKFVFLFRDPFERAWSQWCMQYSFGLEGMTFADAIRNGRSRVLNSPPLSLEHRLFTYVERGLYAEQVERVLDYFPEKQVCFLCCDDLKASHVSTLKKIAAFLGIQPFVSDEPKSENLRAQISYPCAPTEADLRFFAGLVTEDVFRFAALTGIDVSGWTVVRGVNVC